MSQRTKKVWRWFLNLNRPLQVIAALLAIVVFAAPLVYGLIDGNSSADTRIVSPKDGDRIPRSVEIEFFLADSDLRDQENDIAFSHCAGPRCYLLGRLVATGDNRVYQRYEFGPVQLRPGEGRFVLRVDRLGRNKLDALLHEKEKERAASPDNSWKGIEPERLGSEPVHSITVQRVDSP
ncbi:hypothetical protein K1W54_34760 [Micromonospora sp. CPCC 205371]|nr:hypothetical protein [Micromonospora sp. CPCC 205371]